MATAIEEYRHKMGVAQDRLVRIQHALAVRNLHDEMNWSHVADLGRLNEQLAEICEWLCPEAK